MANNPSSDDKHRRKPEEIVKESQKIFHTLKKAGWWLAILVIVAIIFSVVKEKAGEKKLETVFKEATESSKPVTPVLAGRDAVTSGKRSVLVTAPYGVDQTGNPVCSEKVDISGNLDYNFRPAEGEPGGCILVVLNGKQNKVCRDESIPLGLKKLKNQEKAEIQFCSLENRQIRMVLDIYRAGA